VDNDAFSGYLLYQCGGGVQHFRDGLCLHHQVLQWRVLCSYGICIRRAVVPFQHDEWLVEADGLISLETETVSKTSYTKSALIQPIAWKDFII
jgi:hypothetical protein